MFVTVPLYHTTKQRFLYLQTILNNIFYSDEQKEEFIAYFQKAQRMYRAFSRLATNFRRKHTVLQTEHDLFMNPISATQKNVMTIYQNNAGYLFTIMDLKRLIDTSLAHSPRFITEPLSVKNPYNNMPFSLAILYSIYFFMKQSDTIMSTLFHRYFLVNFNLKQFKKNNSVFIRDLTIRHQVYSGSVETLSSVCRAMIHNRNRNHRKKCHILIHKEFPNELLVKIMRPYLHLYYRSIYSLDIYAKYEAEEKLEWELNRLFQHNAKFGRKYLTHNPLFNKTTITFDTNCCGLFRGTKTDAHIVVDSDPEEDIRIVEHHREPSPDIVMAEEWADNDDDEDEEEELDFDW
jgi:hypothetical protein